MGPPTCFSALCTFYLVVRVKMKGDKNHPDGSGGSGDGGVAKSANLFAELQKNSISRHVRRLLDGKKEGNI